MSKPPPPPIKPSSKFTISTGQQSGAGQRIALYGEGGIGKSTLAALAPSPIVLDLDGESSHLNTSRVVIESWEQLIEAIVSPSLAEYHTVVIDNGTKAQELCSEHVCRKNGWATLEDPGYGKGYKILHDEFIRIFSQSDTIARAGRNTILVLHDTTETVRNPEGEDFPQYQPSLLNAGKTGRIRDRLKSWCDHLLFVKYDTDVSRGKAKGGGSRAVWPQAQPTFWAKSRTMRNEVVLIEGSDEVWKQLGIK